MDRYHYHVLDVLSGVLLIVGGLNWLFVGLFQYDVVSHVLYMPMLIRFAYILVGAAAIYMLRRMPSLYHIGGRSHAPPFTPPMAV